jgi:hypothetical protein
LAAAWWSDARAEEVTRYQRSVVVCITNYEPPQGAYRIRPHTCEFHQAGAFPIAGYNTVRGGSIHWRHWGRWNATGRGRIALSTYGRAPARFRLSQPRSHCGANVFSVLQIWYRTHFRPHRHYSRIRITSCLT